MIVTWDYLKVNRPEIVVSFLQNAREGKIARSTLAGLAHGAPLNALIDNAPVRTRSRVQNRVSKSFVHPELKPPAPAKANLASLLTINLGLKKENVDEGSKDLGSFPVGDRPSFVFEETIPVECDFKVFCISKDFEIFQVATLTGALKNQNGVMVEEIDHKVSEPKSPAMFHAKAGQAFRIVLVPTQKASNAGPGDILGAWAVDSPTISYGGAIKAHYYNDTIGCTTSPNAITLIKGGSAYIPVYVHNGAPVGRTVTVQSHDLPAGISIESQQVALGPNETRTVNLHTLAAADAAEVHSAFMTIKVASTDGKVSTTAGFSINVYLPFYAWSFSGSCGKIDHSSTLTVASNGLWHWTGHMHDNSTWYGDDYDYLFYFNRQATSGHNLGEEIQGTLGAEYSGPAVDRDIDLSGQNTDIQQHFGQYVDAGYHWYISVAGDISQLLKPVAEWLAANGVALILLA